MKANIPSTLDAEFAAAFHELGGATHTTTGNPEKAASPASQSDPWRKFFYTGRGYFLDTGRLFIPMNQQSVNRHLLAEGYSPKAEAKFDPSPLSFALNSIETEQFVQYAGPVAGSDRGLMQFSDGKRILVTESPKVPESALGKWDTLKGFLEGLVSDDDERQLMAFHGWVKTSYESLRRRKYRPAPVLGLCGPVQGGKSLLIEILSRILGGRKASAHQWLSGEKEFNLACAGAELLVVDDKFGSTDPRARAKLSQNIKAALFAPIVSIEGKGRDSFDLRPWWRIVIALNDDPQSMLVLPPLTTDIFDKLALIKCKVAVLPDGPEEQDAFLTEMTREIPAYLQWLISDFNLPDELKNQRCGVTAYRHADLVDALQSLAPEEQMKQFLVDAIKANFIETPIKMMATEVQAILTAEGAMDRHAARTLLHWHGACGGHLGRLATLHPEWIEKAGKLHGVEQWLIKRASPGLG
jgi:hypothetical protein